MRSLGAVLGTVCVAVACLVGQGAASQMKDAFIAPSATAVSGGSACQLNLSSGTYPVIFAAVAGVGTPARPVDVLVDPRYPLLGTTRSSAKGLYDHLSQTLVASGWGAPVRMVSTDQAVAALDDPRTILVVGSGTMPEPLIGDQHLARLKRFLDNGGELVFIGDGLLYWSSRAGETSISANTPHLGWAGEQALLGRDLVHSTTARDPSASLLGTDRSASADWLGVSYQRASRGALLTELEALHGWDLGIDTVVAPARTSLAVVPVGRGRLVLFGSTLSSSEVQVSADIARVLLSGSDAAPPVAQLAVRVGHLHSATESIGPGATTPTTPTTPTTTATPAAVRVLVYNQQGFAFFSHTYLCPLSATTAAVPTARAFVAPAPTPAIGDGSLRAERGQRVN